VLSNAYIFTWKCSVPRVEVKEIMKLVQGDADGRLNKKLVFKYSHRKIQIRAGLSFCIDGLTIDFVHGVCFLVLKMHC
jgi:hypothetical protein